MLTEGKQISEYNQPGKWKRLLRFATSSWRLNLAGAMEFRFSFLLTVGTMIVNNMVWIIFWGMYFRRFPVLNGWTLQDVMMMWAAAAGGFGIMAVFFGNATRLANLIASGQLDVFLAQPKPILLNVLISRMSVSAITATIAGYSFKQLMWYLVFTESMVLATPSLCTRIEEEVKSGDVAFKLIRPVSFLAFHYVEYMSEVAIRFMINLLLGTAIGLLLVGPPPVGVDLAWLPLLALGGFTVNFMIGMLIALSAFWVEETRGLEFVYNKILFTIGGMLMPLELFPETLQKIGLWLPFQAIVYFPARTAVGMDHGEIPVMLAIQWLWAMLIGLAVWLVYRRGVRKLNVNGG